MIYIPSNSLFPAYNQAFEQAVFELCTEGDILLLWVNSPCVVCGRNQNIFAEISIPQAERDDVYVIRRDTGGGTVYHDFGNVNYTLITDAHGIAIDYDRILSVPINALRKIGVDAEKFGESGIGIGGRKISGSAQRQTKTRLLHHGTLLYSADLDALRRYSRGREGFTSNAIASDRCEVTNIIEHKDFDDTLGFANAFLDACLGDGEIIPPNYEIRQRTDELCREKYLSWDWTYGKNPAFSCKKEHENITVEYSSKKGIITEMSITIDGNPLNAERFIGARLECGTIDALCGEVVPREYVNAIYKMILGETDK